MNYLVTGADGFVGRALVARLLSRAALPALGEGRAQITLLDRRFDSAPRDARVRTVSGDMSDRAVLREALGDGVDCVFHLASVPGGAAEADYELGMRGNLEATVGLFELLRRRARPARVVFASSIGVYGVPLPALIDERTEAEPTLSYGAHKLIGEILLSDYSRRGFLDGVALRLPGIVARPPRDSGLLSAFMSDLIRTLSTGGRFKCPVEPEGRAWWMSRSCAVDNLLHAAALGTEQTARRRVYLPPVLHASMAEVVAAISRIHGEEVLTRVTYEPNARLQAQFASLPPLECPSSLGAGFHDDGTLEALVRRAI